MTHILSPFVWVCVLTKIKMSIKWVSIVKISLNMTQCILKLIFISIMEACCRMKKKTAFVMRWYTGFGVSLEPELIFSFNILFNETIVYKKCIRNHCLHFKQMTRGMSYWMAVLYVYIWICYTFLLWNNFPKRKLIYSSLGRKIAKQRHSLFSNVCNNPIRIG